MSASPPGSTKEMPGVEDSPKRGFFRRKRAPKVEEDKTKDDSVKDGKPEEPEIPPVAFGEMFR